MRGSGAGRISPSSGARRLLRRRGVRVLLAAQAVAALVLLLRGASWLQPAELAAYDALVLSWAGEAPSERILLVAATEADIGRHGWPLPDGTLAVLLDRLAGWGAEAVGVDIYRDRPLPPGQAALADTLERHPRIVWVGKLADASGRPGIPPPAVLAGTPRAALADMVADAGGVVRRGLLAATDPETGRTVRGLGTALAELALGARLRSRDGGAVIGAGRVVLVEPAFGPYARVDAGGYQTLLDFHGGRARFRRLSLEDVLRDDAAAPLVRGRIVLVGTDALSVKDSFATPLGAGRADGRLDSGVSLHAHLADQLIRLHEGASASRAALPRPAEAAIVWTCALLAATLALAGGALMAALATLGGGALVALAAWAAFGAGLVLPVVPALLAWAGSAGAATWVMHGIGRRERLRIRRSFEHYLDPRIIDDLLAGDTLPAFGGETRDVSVLFTDLAGFTTLSEAMPPAQVAALLGDYFDGVCAAVLDSGGMVSVFLGDGMLALFGAPQRQDDHADRAVEAALRIDAFAIAFAAARRAEGIAFGVTRIGVHSGFALVGNIGTRARLNYGALGDVPNTASRLEGVNKRTGTRIAVSAETARRCARHRFRPLGEFVLPGRQSALAVVTPLGAEEGGLRLVVGET